MVIFKITTVSESNVMQSVEGWADVNEFGAV